MAKRPAPKKRKRKTKKERDMVVKEVLVGLLLLSDGKKPRGY